MLFKENLSPIAKCILASISPILIFSSSVSAGVQAAACGSSPTTTCGVTPYQNKDLYFIDSTGTAFINDPSSNANVYMNKRKQDDVQSLTVSGTDMSGKYIQASYTGTANITLEKGATADMIEVGATGRTTNTNIVIDNANLNGEQDNVQYNKSVGDKAYMMGAAIYIDPLDNGVHSVSVKNNSQLHGSIITGGAATQTISMDKSSLEHGGIYSVSLKSDNIVSLNNATLDASQSEVAGNIDLIAQQISQTTGKPIPQNLSQLDDIGIALIGTTNNQLTMNQSTVTGDIALQNETGTNQINMQGSTVNGNVIMENKTGDTEFAAVKSTVNGNVNLQSQNGKMEASLADDTVIEGDLVLNNTNSPAVLNSVAGATTTQPLTQLSLSASTVQGDVNVSNSSGQVNVVLDNSSVEGGLAIAAGSGNTDLTVQSNSQVAGDVTLSGTGNAQIMLTNSQMSGNIDTSASSGNSSIIISDATTVAGDVKTGSGNDSIVVVSGSSVNGNIDGGAGSNAMVMDSSSAFNGQLTNVNAVYATQDNAITTPEINGSTVYNLTSKSMLVGQTMSDATINMSTDSSVLVTGAVTGVNSLTINQMAKTSQEGQSIIASFDDVSQGTINYQFANGKHDVAARSGAWNYDVTASSVPMNNGLSGSEIMITQTHSGLANDVKGAIAGLDGAKQSGLAVVADIANRMDNLHSSFLMNGISEGAHLWGDYLYQNGDYTDDVDYHSNLQGMQGGVDWSKKLTNGDSLTGGIALAYTRNRVNNSDANGNFNNTVYGNFYSLYGGWQQHLHDNRWGMFVDGSFSLGDIRYSMSANNVQSSTTGMQEALNGSYDGDMYDIETRTGVNIKASPNVLIQPYAVLGWNKVDSDEFSDAQISFGKNQVSSWHTGGGLRITGNIKTAKLDLMPWIDARYITEFSDNSAIQAADYRENSGHNQKMGIVGAGINAAITKNLHFTSGIYAGMGDVDNSVSVQAGLNYNF
ncbi:autotransporter outer membrane beta-barrel domain-containing protein [Dryocola clanedunensis]|uniref:autotransporter outer membrane beta-barrel domain-containing protein n=1 Tax=Cedecea sulfonylureivorans TaxID=3051154 RepID=UPI001927AD13|nr:autotransporter outer membrane beta-barrel domain-containing protein [Cedecea sulfonylureivorans]